MRFLFVLCVVLGVSTSGFAQDLNSAVAQVGEDAELLSVEKLPDGNYLIDVNIGQARIPAKVSGTGEVVWKPVPEFTRALQSLLQSGALAKSSGESELPVWTAVPRMAAFPVIVTRKRIVTPFGAMDAATPSLTPLEELTEHARRWVFDVTRDESAIARIDLIVQEDASWLQVTQVLFSLAQSGYFQLSLIVQRGPNIAVMDAYSPIVVGVFVAPEELLTAAVYPVGPILGWRLSKAGQEVSVEESRCDLPGANLTAKERTWASQMTFCSSDRQAIRGILQHIFKDELSRRTLFAFPSEMTFGMVIGVLELTADLRKHPPIVSFVQ